VIANIEERSKRPHPSKGIASVIFRCERNARMFISTVRPNDIALGSSAQSRGSAVLESRWDGENRNEEIEEIIDETTLIVDPLLKPERSRHGDFLCTSKRQSLSLDLCRGKIIRLSNR
jgi:hypothetical protein